MDWWSRLWTAVLERVRTWAGAPPSPGAQAGLWWPGSGDGAVAYAALYKSQPHVRTVVDFLASQLGQLGIQVFRRLSDTDRVRVHDHPLAHLLRAPNPGTARYAWITDIVQDWAVFGAAYSIKLRRPGRLELYRVSPTTMRPFGDLIVRGFYWTLPDGRMVTLAASEVFYLRAYNPDDPVAGLSPLETLRKVLAAEEAATDYRKWFWANGAKLSGWIARPKDAPKWQEPQRKQFGEEWRGFQGPANAGKTAILEDGMEFHPITATARDSELTEARKLTREEVAAAYHVPPAMLGILEAQGYGSLREQHKALYQDTLGPCVSMLEGEIERQLLPEFSDSEDVYVQFNINEKLQGSFEEEQSALSTAVGSPYMSRNEARARLNLPRINDAAFDTPVTRLDIAEGQNAKTAGAAAPAPAVAANAEPVWSRQGVRSILRALRGLPQDVAASLPEPAPVAVVTRAVRDQAGLLTALEEHAADGTVVSRRLVVRDAAGRAVSLAHVPDAVLQEEPPCRA